MADPYELDALWRRHNRLDAIIHAAALGYDLRALVQHAKAVRE